VGRPRGLPGVRRGRLRRGGDRPHQVAVGRRPRRVPRRRRRPEEIETFREFLEVSDADFEDTFLTAASPGVAAATLVNDYYDSHEAFLHAVGEALNEATRSIPDDRIRLHTCWGSYEGPHHRDKPPAEILPELYELDIGGISIEQANPRHQHAYRAFREHPLPDGWDLIPGVIDVKTNVVEHPDVVADRLERVADAVGDPSRIVAAPDCGFDTQAGLAMVHPEIAWAKLEALVDGAAVATDRLFG
jgi:5-methyltetrahydropteroyltriglutamate--homocysteine methyltransferase